jgi:hypothetical protein
MIWELLKEWLFRHALGTRLGISPNAYEAPNRVSDRANGAVKKPLGAAAPKPPLATPPQPQAGASWLFPVSHLVLEWVSCTQARIILFFSSD